MARDERQRVADDEFVTVDATYLRDQTRQAISKFFRPITAGFEITRRASSVSGKDTTTFDRVSIPKSPRVEMRGYAIKKRDR